MLFFKTNKPNPQQPRQRRQPSTILGEHERPEIFSYRAKRGERPDNPRRAAPFMGIPSRTSAERSTLWRRLKLTILALVLLALVVDQSLVTRPPKIVFDSPSVSSYHYDATTYAAAAQRITAGSVFDKTKWTFNTAQLNVTMQQDFPELADVRTTLPLLGGTPTIHLMPGTPTLLLTTTTNQTFVIDERGVAVATAKSSQPVAGLLTVTDQSGIKVQVGHAALPSSTVTFIKGLVTELQSQKIQLSSAALPASSSELDIHIVGANYIGKFNLQNNVRAQAGTFAAVKGRLDSTHTAVGQYIDVRLPGRAYYQ